MLLRQEGATSFSRLQLSRLCRHKRKKKLLSAKSRGAPPSSQLCFKTGIIKKWCVAEIESQSMVWPLKLESSVSTEKPISRLSENIFGPRFGFGFFSDQTKEASSSLWRFWRSYAKKRVKEIRSTKFVLPWQSKFGIKNKNGRWRKANSGKTRLFSWWLYHIMPVALPPCKDHLPLVH